MNKQTILLYLIGTFTLIVSWTQWFFLFPDTSQLVLGTGISICIFFFTYMLNWLKKLSHDVTNLEKRVDLVVKFYIKEELE